jgi:hypothetical protein
MKPRKFLAALGVTIVASVGLVALTASPASAGTYTHQLVHSSGYCVESPTPYLGQQLILNYCGGPASHNQHFTFEDAGYLAWHYYIHLENSPYCLVPGNADLFNSTIILWVCDYSSDKFIWILGFPHYPNIDDRDLANDYSAYCMDTSVVPTAGEYLRATGCLRGWYNLHPVSS